MLLIFVGIIIIGGLFNPWTGLLGNTLYAPKKPRIDKPIAEHKSFRLTKEY